MGDLLSETTIFCDDLDHPECVAVHPDGTVWAGGEAGQIYRIDADGKNSQMVASTGGFILGIAFSPNADWLAACDLKHKCVWKLNLRESELSMLTKGSSSQPLNIPNYPAFDEQGNLYVSESGAFREISGKIFKYTHDGRMEIWHPGPFNFANGLALDANRQYLYVVSSWLPGVERIEILPDGSAGNRDVFCIMPKTVPDGLAFDAEGNLYVSCYTPHCIYRVTPSGKASVMVDDWEAHTISTPTNIAFGGEQFDQLFCASLGRWHIARINLGIIGLPLPCHSLNSDHNEK